MLPKLPSETKSLLSALRAGGGLGFVVGGALRDMLLGRPVHDWDIATTLAPEVLLDLFSAARPIGGRYGTVLVRWQGVDFEITPCRSEEDYTDNRHPGKVQFHSNILTDLSRRDFTINAMAYDGEVLLDPFGGRQDLENRVLRCVGSPLKRFNEDALRVLRMVRFAAKLGFGLEKSTYVAAQQTMSLVAMLPRERVRAELSGILLSQRPQKINLLIEGGALNRYGLYHAPDLAVLANVPAIPLCRWWALAHLCGVNTALLCEKFGFSRRFAGQLGECNRLFASGPAMNAEELRKKLRGTEVEYDVISTTFATIAPAYKREPALFAGVRARREAYRVRDLAVNGDDLSSLAIDGTQCGRVLDELLGAVVADPALNERELLLDMARALRDAGGVN